MSVYTGDCYLIKIKDNKTHLDNLTTKVSFMLVIILPMMLLVKM